MSEAAGNKRRFTGEPSPQDVGHIYEEHCAALARLSGVLCELENLNPAVLRLQEPPNPQIASDFNLPITRARDELCALRRSLQRSIEYLEFLRKRSFTTLPQMGYFAVLPLELLGLCLTSSSPGACGSAKELTVEDAISHKDAIYLCSKALVCKIFHAQHFLLARTFALPPSTFPRDPKSVLQILHRYPRLKQVSLSPLKLSDVAPIAQHCPRLTILDLSDSKVSTIESLAMCSRLEVLVLNKCTQIEDVQPLAACSKLKSISVQHAPIRSISFAAHCPKLRCLDLTYTLVEDLSPLSCCTRLEVLKLCQTGISDASAIQNCSSIQRLDLSQTNISDIRFLHKFVNLRDLRLAVCPLLHDISVLGNCCSLSILSISRTEVQLPHQLALCTNLTALNVQYSAIDWRTAVAHAPMPSVRVLRLSSTQEFRDSHLVRVAVSYPNMQRLELKNTKVRSIMSLLPCTELQSLDLTHTKVQDGDINVLAHLPNLTELNLSSTRISRVDVLAKCTALKSLNVRHTQVRDVSALLACTQLARLNISGTIVADVSALSAHPSLVELDISETALIASHAEVDFLTESRVQAFLRLRPSVKVIANPYRQMLR
eukprot:gnl/Spiro4/21273_TR10383_c0_g1_i1.p1 gnl/Spiro4/21273_TR10383_c0_g1~~gnl/Spiro4/21273_TR10383_c0_g1_i1.p1  ORF type:complete len:601 (+),score=132.06 gnl/Spiro4/21273_TR10383_c0_g1_i1:69-1871(+)